MVLTYYTVYAIMYIIYQLQIFTSDRTLIFEEGKC